MKFAMATACALLLATTDDGCSGEYDMQRVRGEASHWLGEMGYAYYGFSCSDTDSDGDGYVSCTVNLKEHPDPLLIECRARNGHGCRGALPKAIVGVR